MNAPYKNLDDVYVLQAKIHSLEIEHLQLKEANRQLMRENAFLQSYANKLNLIIKQHAYIINDIEDDS